MAPGFWSKAKGLFSGIKNVVGKVWNGFKNVAPAIMQGAAGMIGGIPGMALNAAANFFGNRNAAVQNAQNNQQNG